MVVVWVWLVLFTKYFLSSHQSSKVFTLNWVGRSFRWSKWFLQIFLSLTVYFYTTSTSTRALVLNPTEKWECIVCSWVYLIRSVYCLWHENKTILYHRYSRYSGFTNEPIYKLAWKSIPPGFFFSWDLFDYKRDQWDETFRFWGPGLILPLMINLCAAIVKIISVKLSYIGTHNPKQLDRLISHKKVFFSKNINCREGFKKMLLLGAWGGG